MVDVAYPDAVAVILAGLRPAVAVPVAQKVPTPRPAAFVVVRRVGGPRRMHGVDEPTLQVDSWGPTEAAAHDLAQQVRTAMHGLAHSVVDGHNLYRVQEVGGPAVLPDDLSDQPRYRQAFAVMIRGASLP